MQRSTTLTLDSAKVLRSNLIQRPKARSPLLMLSAEKDGCRSNSVYNPYNDRVYETKSDFSGYRFLGNSGKWFLVVDSRMKLYIIDVFSEKRIDLPPLESFKGSHFKILRDGEENVKHMQMADNDPFRDEFPHAAEDLRGRLWVEDKNGNYVVVWQFEKNQFLGFCRTGDDHYREIPTQLEVQRELRGLYDMVLKGYNLYVFATREFIRHLDLSGQDEDGFKDVSEKHRLPMWMPRLTMKERESRNHASFWFDSWTPLGPLYNCFGSSGPSSLRVPLNATVSDVCNHQGWIIANPRSDQGVSLQIHLSTIALPSDDSGPDEFDWVVENKICKGFSSAKTWAVTRPRAAIVDWWDSVWFKGHIPKHAFNMWIATLDRLPTKTRLSSWGLQIQDTCGLCSLSPESRDHLFLSCDFALYLWNAVASYSQKAHCPIGHLCNLEATEQSATQSCLCPSLGGLSRSGPRSEELHHCPTTQQALLQANESLVALIRTSESHRMFRLYKRDPKDLDPKTLDTWLLEVHSLGDEALFLDLGITVPADHTLGIEPNSIYFTRGDRIRHKESSCLDICVFNLITKTIKRFHGLSNFNFYDAKWFLPS
ncbi:Reverse transcriptase zinc-binding domain [Arabidopsis thaliana x Arabidopsis arenosa]|uniref:Reverse transcriptase zinc-binding domain n=1 Tax=Arabidopsis thaliana x Arabidopsis arenosa TaxID=1240361 RepID=A0A8T1XBX2_9BRAS|nr:Reverse transcriptase zinc-binding domain [Arabidopsis thaliana x Arabidopsis arenosa]